MLGWTLVQIYWKKTFAANISDEDVLAERRSCSNCGCTTVCTRKEGDNFSEDLIYNEVKK